MLHTIDNRIHRLASLRNVLILAIIYVGTSVLIFNIGIVPRLMEQADGMGLLDNTFGYTPQRVYTLFDTLGANGRQLYGTYLLAFDFLYPILFAVTNSIVLAYLLESLFGPKRSFVFLYLLPFVALLFDFVENLSLLALLWLYPTQLAALAIFAEIVTATKLALVNFLFIVTLMVLAGVLFKTLYARIRS